jgi:hypothetical protein
LEETAAEMETGEQVRRLRRTAAEVTRPLAARTSGEGSSSNSNNSSSNRLARRGLGLQGRSVSSILHTSASISPPSWRKQFPARALLRAPEVAALRGGVPAQAAPLHREGRPGLCLSTRKQAPMLLLRQLCKASMAALPFGGVGLSLGTGSHRRDSHRVLLLIIVDLPRMVIRRPFQSRKACTSTIWLKYATCHCTRTTRSGFARNTGTAPRSCGTWQRAIVLSSPRRDTITNRP